MQREPAVEFPTPEYLLLLSIEKRFTTLRSIVHSEPFYWTLNEKRRDFWCDLLDDFYGQLDPAARDRVDAIYDDAPDVRRLYDLLDELSDAVEAPLVVADFAGPSADLALFQPMPPSPPAQATHATVHQPLQPEPLFVAPVPIVPRAHMRAVATYRKFLAEVGKYQGEWKLCNKQYMKHVKRKHPELNNVAEGVRLDQSWVRCRSCKWRK